MSEQAKQVIIQDLVVKAPSRRPWDVGDWRSALRSADNGRVAQLYDLYEDMLIDGVLSDAVSKRKQAVLNSALIFLDAEGKEVDLIGDLMDTNDWEVLLSTIIDTRFYGRSGVELELLQGELKVHPIPPKHIDLTTESIILDLTIPDKKVTYQGDPALIVLGKSGDHGLLLKAMPYAIYKRGGFGDWSQWIELFGMPQRIGKYNTYDPESKRLLESAMEQAGSAPYLIIPKESEIDIRESNQGNGTSFNEFRQACNEEILISILGQTLTTISGERGARSLGEVHKSVEEGKNRSDMKFVQRVLNSRLLPLLEARGIQGVSGGHFLFPEDTEEISVSELVQLSTILPIPTSYLYDKYGIPTPKEGETIAGQKLDQQTPPSQEKKVENNDAPFPTAPLASAKPAEPLKTSWFKKWTSSITAPLKLKGNSPDDGYTIDLKALLNQAINEVYGGEQVVSESLFAIQNNALQQAVDRVMSEPIFGQKNGAFIEQFRYNTAVFSAFKAHSETEAMVALLHKPNGSLRSFSEFKKLALKLSPKWNEQWLRTEYNTAIRSARSAVNYRNALTTKHLYPNLEYVVSTAKEKRPDHLALVGTVLPIEHPWWDTHLPPSEWNCKCSVRPTNKPVSKVPKDSGTPPTFQNNAGKTAQFIKLREHPYLKGKGSPSCPECRRQGLAQETKLLDYEDLLCPMHRIAWEALKNDRKARQKKAESIVKEWAVKNIPEIDGVVIENERFYTHNVVIRRKSIKDLLGHSAEPTHKLIAMHIKTILEECEFSHYSEINIDSHNREKKLLRGAIGFAYYEFKIEEDTYELNMEVRKDGYETPYSIRQKKNS